MAQWERIHLPTRETRVQSLDWEAPLEKEMAACSSILAWKIPWTEELGGSQRVGLWPMGHKQLDMTEHTAHTHDTDQVSKSSQSSSLLIRLKSATSYDLGHRP